MGYPDGAIPRLPWETNRLQGCRNYGTRHSLLSLYFDLFCATSLSILLRICVYIHISDCLEIVYELPLLPSNTASETFLLKSGTARSVDWIFIIGVPAWRWLGEFVILDKTFCNLRNKPLRQVSKWDPDQHSLSNTTAVQCVYTANCPGSTGFSARALSLLFCEWIVNTFWQTTVEVNNKCLHKEVKISM